MERVASREAATGQVAAAGSPTWNVIGHHPTEVTPPSRMGFSSMGLRAA